MLHVKVYFANIIISDPLEVYGGVYICRDLASVCIFFIAFLFCCFQVIFECQVISGCQHLDSGCVVLSQ